MPLTDSILSLVYISGRPFVLRDAAEPRRTLSISDRAENLEAIETRMKNDILVEAARYGGVILTHNEVASETTGEGAILPTWTAVDANNVKTSKDLWGSMKRDGWNVDVRHSLLQQWSVSNELSVLSYPHFSRSAYRR